MISIKTPAIKAHLRTVPVSGEGALLLSETGAHVLKGRIYEAVVPLIDGRRSADEIVEALAPQVTPATVWYALLRLEQAGYLAESAPEIPEGIAAFWSSLGLDVSQVHTALEATTVRVLSAGVPVADRFAAALGQFGVNVVTDETDVAADMEVILAANYLADELIALYEAAHHERRRCLLVRPTGLEIWVGPLFEPGETGCLHCLRLRLERNRPAHGIAARNVSKPSGPPPVPAMPALEEAIYVLAAVETAKILAGVESTVADAIVALDLRDLSMHTHRLVANPACAYCGTPPVDAPAPVHLQPGSASVDTDSGFRTSTPSETLAKYGHLVSPVTGIVSALNPMELDTMEDVANVGHAYVVQDRFIKPPTRLDDLQSIFRTVSMGKGTTDAQARASALCESLEMYSSMRNGGEAVRQGTFRELGDDAIHPNEVMRFSERQYRNRNVAKTLERRFSVPEPFDPDLKIDWTPVWSLTAGRHRLLPTDLIYMNDDQHQVAGSPNGCATGNTLEEAVLHGLYELIERDAIGVWWYNRLSMPGVDITAFDDPWLSGLPAYYRTLGREVVALDLTHDFGIPVIAGISYQSDEPRERIHIGFGCHLDVATALRRAMLEVRQAFSIWHSEDEHQGEEIKNTYLYRWLTKATRASQPYVVPDSSVPPRTRAEFPSPPGPDMLASINLCQRVVEAQGLEVLVGDLTRPDVGLPAVRVIVPGLREFRPRFAPGRLYDVPVNLGWIDRPLSEEELNPIPFIF